MDSFPARLSGITKKYIFSDDDIEKILNMDKRIKLLEAGIEKPTADDIKKLSEFFGVSADYLLGIKIEPKKIRLNNFISLPDGYGHDIELGKNMAVYRDGEIIDNKYIKIALKLLSEAVQD